METADYLRKVASEVEGSSVPLDVVLGNQVEMSFVPMDEYSGDHSTRRPASTVEGSDVPLDIVLRSQVEGIIGAFVDSPGDHSTRRPALVEYQHTHRDHSFQKVEDNIVQTGPMVTLNGEIGTIQQTP